MHVRWKKKTLTSNRQSGEYLCPHSRVDQPVTLTPVMMAYTKGTSLRSDGAKRTPKYREVWRPGPSIRECCLKNPQAQAAWWWEVRQRFEDLRKDGIEGEHLLTQTILESQPLFEALLATVVPMPTPKEIRRYAVSREGPRRAKIRLPMFVRTLGIANWPCTQRELQAAWRKLALQHHPDRGGDQVEFIRVKAAYDRAVERLSTT